MQTATMPNKCSFFPLPKGTSKPLEGPLAERDSKWLGVSESGGKRKAGHSEHTALAELVVLSMELKCSGCHREQIPHRTWGHDGLQGDLT